MSTDPLIGKVLDGRFEVEERIGEGGSSVIYRANQIGVDRPVALKVLAGHVAEDPEWVRRFHQSAQAFARVSHPNAVRIYDFGTSLEGYHFIAMEHLSGDTLRRLLDAGPVPARRALGIVALAARALGAVHASGIVHRDFKPESIHLGADEGAPPAPARGPRPAHDAGTRLLFSTVIKSSDANAPKTRPGKVLGTPRYLSPEQIRGERPGPASDIYAAGVVLHEMLAGSPPFDAASPTELALMHLRQAPPPLPDAPGIAAAIVMRALAKDPHERQQSAEELARECEDALSVL